MALKNGEMKAKQILEAVRNLNIYKDDKRIPISISIGVTDNLTCTAKYFKELFNVADLRLYIGQRTVVEIKYVLLIKNSL